MAGGGGVREDDRLCLVGDGDGGSSSGLSRYRETMGAPLRGEDDKVDRVGCVLRRRGDRGGRGGELGRPPSCRRWGGSGGGPVGAAGRQ